MPETPQPNPEEQRVDDVDRKKYRDAMHQLFLTLMEFRRLFGSSPYESGYATWIDMERNEQLHEAVGKADISDNDRIKLRRSLKDATQEYLSEGTESFIRGEYKGLTFSIDVKLIDDIAVHRAEFMGEPNNAEPFRIEISIENESDSVYYHSVISVGLQECSESFDVWVQPESTLSEKQAIESFVSYFRPYFDTLIRQLDEDYYFYDDVDMDSENLLSFAQGLKHFIDDRDTEYTLAETTNDRNESLANEQS